MSSPSKSGGILSSLKSKITGKVKSVSPSGTQGHHLGQLKDVHPDTHEHLVNSLEVMVDKSGKGTVEESAIAPSSSVASQTWFSKLYDVDTFHKLFAHEHLGNFVQIRHTDERVWETMPIYVRVGMHILFCGPAEKKLLGFKDVEELLTKQSIKQGKVYDEEDPKIVLPHIESFIKTYKIETSELLQPDPTKYKTFNEFFARKLKPDARLPVDSTDLSIITSAADSRLTVWKDVDDARKFWVKGKQFTIPNLLGNDSELIKLFGKQPSLAIFRLAPQDYHRFHAPFDATIESVKHIAGELYTVNPQAVNEDFDVFTANKRDIAILQASITPSSPETKTPVAFIAVGAMLVGSIGWSKQPGESIKKGEDLGWFQYGGSTVIVVIPEGKATWDEDLLATSEKTLETLVKVGERIGKSNE